MIPESILKPVLDTSFTSTGMKLFYHQEALAALQSGGGKPISCWVAPTDVCNAKCSFCSVGERVGDVLAFHKIETFLRTLADLGLKSVTFSGGGNPLIYKCKESGKGISDLILLAHEELGLDCAMITNGMPLIDYNGRNSWKSVSPEVLDMLTWCRISMAGLDHNHREQRVYVPDFDQSKTSLGFSWIFSDSYEEPSHKHGWVSTVDDIKTDVSDRKVVLGVDRLPWIEEQISKYVEEYTPRYVRLLCNCLEPDRIPERHALLQGVADRINPRIVFSQNKPPRQPSKCFKVLTRPCLNADGWVYPCDSVVLNETADHQFGSAWRICRGEDIGNLYANPSSYSMPDNICPGCVFADQVDVINSIVNGSAIPEAPVDVVEHVNFV